MDATFRQRLNRGERMIGSFIKTPAPHIVEIAGLAKLDFVVLDAEHAPFTSRELDLCMLAGRAARLDVLVRLRSGSPAEVQQALDLGAAGVLVPHVGSPDRAAEIVAAARFRGGERGYSNSPRFGDYGGIGMADLLAAADLNAAVILQIEDRAGVEAADAIAAVPGVDALFIGRADLAVAYGADEAAAPLVDRLAARVAESARRSGVALGTFFATAAAYAASAGPEINMVVLGSDQSMLRGGWSAALADARQSAKST